MALSTRLLGRAFLTSLPVFVACSTGKPPTEGDDDVSSGATGGTAAGGTTGNGGSAAGGTGGSAASTGGTIVTTGGVSGSAAVGGTAGDTAAMGGDTSLGGTSGNAASGGDAGTAALGGASGASAAAGMSGMAGTDPGICQHLSAVPTPQVPTVEIVVDTSSSMFETNPTAWSVLYTALDGPDSVLKPLEGQIQFGFASYKGAKAASETDPACATMTTVDPALSNFDAIDMVYKAVGTTYNPASPPSPKWETPTNYAITFAVGELQAYNPMPPGPKYILLVTDGNPNTCEEIDPQCGQDYAIKAVQDAYAAGIGTFVVGVGDIVINGNSGCQGTGARCGLDHLQDLANAGVGAPVMAATGCEDPTSTGCQLRYASCNKGSILTATYAADPAAAPNAGTPFAVDTGAGDAQAKLKAALTELLNAAVSCTFELDVIVTGDAALGLVSVASTPVTFGTPDGWVLESDSFHVTLQGAACEAYRDGGEVSIDFPCDPSGNPIAVHR